jgi:hypothetical protein
MHSHAPNDAKEGVDEELVKKIKFLFGDSYARSINESLNNFEIALDPLLFPIETRDFAANKIRHMLAILTGVIKNNEVVFEDPKSGNLKRLPKQAKDTDAVLTNESYWQHIDKCLVAMHLLLNNLTSPVPVKFNKLKAAFIALLAAITAGLVAAGLGAAGLTIAGVAVAVGVTFYTAQYVKHTFFKPALPLGAPPDAKQLAAQKELKTEGEIFIQNIRAVRANKLRQ